jgi:hypothetical protein
VLVRPLRAIGEVNPAVAPSKSRTVMVPSVPRRNRSPGRVPTRDSGTGVPPARGMKAMRPWYS